MRNVLFSIPVFVYLSFRLVGSGSSVSGSVGSSPTLGQPVQVIEMSARKYEFSPAALHVKQGTMVQLTITATDRDHGFQIGLVPDGAEQSEQPGLEFTSPQSETRWKLRKGEALTLEFLAKTPGRYPIKCSVVCGIGHGRMKAQLVVDP